MPTWLIFALLSAFFAALTSILAKIGIAGVDSNLATAIRTIVIIIFAWIIVAFQGSWKAIPTLNRTNLFFLVLSGLATGLSWFFYFRALQLGDASKVAPIDKLSLVLTLVFAFLLLREKITPLVWLGGGLITLGTVLISFAK